MGRQNNGCSITIACDLPAFPLTPCVFLPLQSSEINPSATAHVQLCSFRGEVGSSCTLDSEGCDLPHVLVHEEEERSSLKNFSSYSYEAER